MRLVFVVWLVVIAYSAANLGMLFQGDVGGWMARSVGFGVPILAIYYGGRWLRKRLAGKTVTKETKA